MVVVNYSGKEINAKIVYYGPGLCGKTTNLERIYDSVPAANKGKMISMKTKTDRTLFFDFLPLELGDIGGFRTRLMLYTVPGQVFYNATRKLVLKGVDAVVFVADSERGKMRENQASLENLRENLVSYGIDADQIPVVFQYNKRDLPEVYSREEMDRSLDRGSRPAVEAVAAKGEGVFETLRIASKLLLTSLHQKLRAAGSSPRDPLQAPSAATGARGWPSPPRTEPERPAPAEAPWEASHAWATLSPPTEARPGKGGPGLEGPGVSPAPTAPDPAIPSEPAIVPEPSRPVAEPAMVPLAKEPKVIPEPSVVPEMKSIPWTGAQETTGASDRTETGDTKNPPDWLEAPEWKSFLASRKAPEKAIESAAPDAPAPATKSATPTAPPASSFGIVQLDARESSNTPRRIVVPVELDPADLKDGQPIELILRIEVARERRTA
jgi:signal recognition particle receptor subunit beta